MLSRIPTISIALGVGSLLWTSPVRAEFLYKLDTLDENPSSRLFPVGLDPRPDYTGQIVGDLMWLNSYKVEVGGEILKSISLTWGATPQPNRAKTTTRASISSGLADWQNQNYPATVLLYTDPNNDGNPNDAKLLTQADTTVRNPDTNLFTTVNIQPTQLQVGQTFFVGALFRNVVRNQRPATANLNGNNPNRSWYAIGNHGDGQPSNIDIENLSNNFRPGNASQSPLPLPTVYGNWVLRAYADQAVPRRVPEPGLILGLGFSGWLAWRRKARCNRSSR
jgi:hypothetical protein